MQEASPVDRVQLDADRERLADLPDDVPCALPVGRVRGYLNALAGALPSPDPPPPPDQEPRLLASEVFRTAAVGSLTPTPPSRPWTFRRLARLPSWGTIAFIVLGGAVVVGTCGWRSDVTKAIGETLIFALVGARAFATVLEREVQKRGPEEVGEEEPGALVGFVLLVVTYMAAAAALHAGAALAGIDVSWIGAGLFGLLVTLSFALDYGVVSADRLASG